MSFNQDYKVWKLQFRYFILPINELIERLGVKTWKIEAAIITADMVLLGVTAGCGVSDFIDKECITNMKGLAKMGVPADKTIWLLMYKDIGDGPSSLYANMEQRNETIVKFLESSGVAKGEIGIAPPEVIDTQAERYGNRDIVYRYNTTSVITVVPGNIGRARQLMSERAELLKQEITISGGGYRYNVVYEFTGLSNMKPQIMEEVTKNVRTTAGELAKDSDSSLGKIRNASQGRFFISDKGTNMPHTKSIRVVTIVNYYLKR